MSEITKDTTIGDVLKIKPNAVPLLMEIGMHCIGCPYAAACPKKDLNKPGHTCSK